MSKESGRPGNPALDGFRGAEPAKGEEMETSTRPVDDDHGSGHADQGNDDPNEGRQPERPEKEEPEQPRKSPSDMLRDKIAARFAERRTHDPDALTDDPPADGETDDKVQRREAGAAEDGDDTGGDEPAPLTLAVHGKTLNKSIEEVAALAELTVDEVRADPQRAIRYAQRELATQENLKKSKEWRDQPARHQDDDRPEPARKTSERQKAGNDDHGQPDTDRDTSDPVDFVKLVEDIQIGTPEEAGQKLKDALNKISKSEVSKAVTETETDRMLRQDRANTRTAMNDFVADHSEVNGNKYMASAIATGLIDEYRDDVVKALVAEGTDQDEANELVRQATPDQIAQAHRARRIKGDPNVRPIDKEFIEKAYERVTQGLGVRTDPKDPKRDFTSQREQRKASLQPQPRRASVPPATDKPAKAPITRSSVVAEMATRTGRRAQTPR